MKHRPILALLLVSLLSSAATAAPAIRALCENNWYDANGLIALRSDVISSYRSPVITIFDDNNSRLNFLKEAQLVYSTGLEAEGFVIVEKPRPTLYFVKVDYPRRRAQASTVSAIIPEGTPSYLRSSPGPKRYAFNSEGLWVATQARQLTLLAWQTWSVKKTINTSADILSVQASQNQVYVTARQGSGTQVLVLEAQKSNFTALLPQQKGEQSLASEDGVFVWTATMTPLQKLQWELFENQVSTGVKIISRYKPLTWKSGADLLSIFYIEEGRNAASAFSGTTHVMTLQNKAVVAQRAAPYSRELMTALANSNQSDQHLHPVAFDETNGKLVLAAGSLGGLVTLDVQSFSYRTHGFLGSSWACYNPATVNEDTAW